MADRLQKGSAVLLLMAGVTAFAFTGEWQRFRSSDHFSVIYPTDWFRIGASKGKLQLLSSKGGAEGIIIKHGQAEITVMEAEASSTKTLAQVMDDYAQGTSVISRRNVLSGPAKNMCSEIKELISKEQPVPPSDTPMNVSSIINTDFFCEAEGHKIVILLRNWEGDKRQDQYQRIALKMTKSIQPLR